MTTPPISSTPSPLASLEVSVQTFVLSHLIWVVAAVFIFIGFHAWAGEHDARLAADAKIQASEATIKDLTGQIAATNAAAAAKVQVVTRIVHDIKTPQQAVVAVPQLTDVPLNPRVAVDNPVQVSVDAVPFVNLLAQAKVDKINLDACTANLTSETAIVAEGQKEIAALKKKPSFWHRAGGIAKSVGVGIGVGLFISGKL